MKYGTILTAQQLQDATAEETRKRNIEETNRSMAMKKHEVERLALRAAREKAHYSIKASSQLGGGGRE